MMFHYTSSRRPPVDLANSVYWAVYSVVKADTLYMLEFPIIQQFFFIIILFQQNGWIVQKLYERRIWLWTDYARPG